MLILIVYCTNLLSFSFTYFLIHLFIQKNCVHLIHRFSPCITLLLYRPYITLLLYQLLKFKLRLMCCYVLIEHVIIHHLRIQQFLDNVIFLHYLTRCSTWFCKKYKEILQEVVRDLVRSCSYLARSSI